MRWRDFAFVALVGRKKNAAGAAAATVTNIPSTVSHWDSIFGNSSQAFKISDDVWRLRKTRCVLKNRSLSHSANQKGK